jgi:HSP20 family molecular chaperone IbpA
MNAAISETIERIEHLYTTLTGRQPSDAHARAPIPPEAEPVVHVQAQLERMVSALEQLVLGSRTPEAAWVPRAAFWTDDTGVELVIDVPGVSRDDVQIRVEPLAITVTGRRRAPWSRPPRGVAGGDVPVGAFVRSFPLAAHVAPEQVRARLDGGVLTIRIHGGGRSEPTQVSITS